MDQRTEPIRQDIDSIRDSMTDKLEQIETKIKGTVEDTRRMVDVKYQVSQRPWAALGVSLLVGYTLGSIGGDDSTPQPRHRETVRYYADAHDDRSRPARDYAADSRTSSFAQHADARRPAQPGMMDQIMEQFGDEFQLLKAAAITSVISLVRDAVRQNLPGLDKELGRLRSEQGDTNSMRSPTTQASGPARTAGSDSSRYYDTADTLPRERAVGERSTQTDVGRNPNYDFIPPAPHAEPGNRP
jgi:hypothetical protein